MPKKVKEHQIDVISYATSAGNIPVTGVRGNFLNSGIGYTDLPGGLILQWGSGTVPDGQAELEVTYAKAFTQVYSVTVSPGQGAYLGQAGNPGTSSFFAGVYFRDGTYVGGRNFFWMAIGR